MIVDRNIFNITNFFRRLIIATLVTSIAIGVPATAMSASQRKIFNYNINYYNECVDGAKAGSGNNDVLKFAAFPIGSTWNLSDEKVEEWFLDTGTSVISKYDINSSNIHQITEVVKSEGVSPAFFYGYTVNEGGGAGGYINHYVSSAMSGDMLKDAQKDAEYLVTEANSENSKPATGGGMPNMDTTKSQEFLDSLPLGSIGKVYIPATSATTGEIEEIFGTFNMDSTRYGRPLASLMGFIEDMGGDPMNPGVDVAEGGSMSMVTCNSSVAGTVNERIVEIAEEWGSWGEKYNTCYVYGGQHGASQEDMDAAIENHFTPRNYGIDCSGFASAVIYKATGIYNMWSTSAMCDDTENFQEVSDPQPGDLAITCHSGYGVDHVAVILEVNSDGSFRTAESSNSGCGPNNGPHYGSFKGDKVLRYIGDSEL